MRHRALVRWLSPQQRGKKALPATLRYVGVARFEQAEPQLGDEGWSVELQFERPPAEESDISEADVRFLFDHAPQERLHAGATFSLYEGPTCVASVEILT